MFTLELSAEAYEDLQQFRKFDQQIISPAINELAQCADQATKNRKRLRPNALSEWVVRVGKFRIFYNIDALNSVVLIIAIGYKEGSKLFVHGEEFEL